MEVINSLRTIIKKPITCENALPLRNQTLLSEIQLNYVQYIVVLRYMENLGMSRKEVVQLILNVVQA